MFSDRYQNLWQVCKLTGKVTCIPWLITSKIPETPESADQLNVCFPKYRNFLPQHAFSFKDAANVLVLFVEHRFRNREHLSFTPDSVTDSLMSLGLLT